MKKIILEISLFLTIAILSLSCTLITSADGSFEEDESSGRILQSADSAKEKHFFKLNLKQFNEIIAGTFESFRLNSYALFLQQPSLMTTAADYYYCSRIDDGYRREENVYVHFTDELNRKWLIIAKLNDSLFSGSLLRINNSKLPVSFPMSACEPLLEEDAKYRDLSLPSEKQLVFKRVSSAVADEKLSCVNYHIKSQINVQIPFPLPPCNRYRLALVSTRTQATNLNNESRDSIGLHEYATATLDLFDINQDENTRNFTLREKPKFVLENKAELALGTIILYEDFPPYNDRWENLNSNAKHSEPVLAYLSNQVLIFHAQETKEPIFARDAEYVKFDEALNPQNWAYVPGWYAYHFVADTIKLPEFSVKLLRKVQQETSNEVKLKSISEACQNCYLSLSQEALDCSDCPAIFPLLSL